MAGIPGVKRAQTPPYEGPMGHMGPWAMDPWAHGLMGPWANGPMAPMAPGPGAGPQAGATLGAGPLRFLRNPSEKRDPEKTTRWAPEKYVFENIIGKIGPEKQG